MDILDLKIFVNASAGHIWPAGRYLPTPDIVELFNLCAKYVVLEVDDFSIGYTLNFVSQLCGYDFLSS